MKKNQIIFDGHNDLLLRLWLEKDYNGKSFFQSTRVRDNNGHLDLKSAQSGGFVYTANTSEPFHAERGEGWKPVETHHD